MNKRQQLYYLLEAFSKSEYSVKDFCEAFEEIFYPDIPTDVLTEQELELFKSLAAYVSRFSPFTEDLKTYPGVYKSESEVKDAIYRTIENLAVRSGG